MHAAALLTLLSLIQIESDCNEGCFCVCFFFATVSVHLRFTNEIIYLVSRMDGNECKQRIGRLFMNADDSLDLQLFGLHTRQIQSCFIMQMFSIRL